MATDIAFSLGILSLLGKRAPLSLRVFLTALAIIDDLGGILTIAIFYTADISFTYLLAALGILVFLIILNFCKVTRQYLYIIPGLLMWYLVFNSGVHATIAGVLLAFTLPLRNIGRMEHKLHDPVSFIILPLFALANTAIILPGDFTPIFSSPVHHGILSGLALGKPLGIFLFSFIAVKVGIGVLPERVGRKHILGMGMIAGIGFTISIFMATLAFTDEETQVVAKIAIIGASLVSGLAGFIYLRMLGAKAVRGMKDPV
jgi:NhaA family Na+:H+ antiporter